MDRKGYDIGFKGISLEHLSLLKGRVCPPPHIAGFKGVSLEHLLLRYRCLRDGRFKGMPLEHLLLHDARAHLDGLIDRVSGAFPLNTCCCIGTEKEGIMNKQVSKASPLNTYCCHSPHRIGPLRLRFKGISLERLLLPSAANTRRTISKWSFKGVSPERLLLQEIEFAGGGWRVGFKGVSPERLLLRGPQRFS